MADQRIFKYLFFTHYSGSIYLNWSLIESKYLKDVGVVLSKYSFLKSRAKKFVNIFYP